MENLGHEIDDIAIILIFYETRNLNNLILLIIIYYFWP